MVSANQKDPADERGKSRKRGNINGQLSRKEFRQIVLKERIETPQPEPFHSDIEEGEQRSVERGEDEHGKQKPLADSLTGGFVHWEPSYLPL